MTSLLFKQCFEFSSAPLLTSYENHEVNNEHEVHAAFENDENDVCGSCETDRCCICLLQLPTNGSRLCTLPCTHKFHSKCIVELRHSDLPQVCPLCRAPLPFSARDIFLKAVKLYCVLEERVSREETSWAKLSREEGEQLIKIIELWKKSANGGVKESYFNLGVMYYHGRGIKQHLRWAQTFFF